MDMALIASKLSTHFKTALLAIFGEEILSSLPSSQQPMLLGETDPSIKIAVKGGAPCRSVPSVCRRPVVTFTFTSVFCNKY